MLVLVAWMAAVTARPNWLCTTDGRAAPLTWGLVAVSAVVLTLRLTLARWRKPDPTGRSALSEAGLDRLLMCALVVGTFAFRTPMTRHGLPYANVWDEVVTYTQSLKMLQVPGLRPCAEVPGYGKSSYGDLVVYMATAADVVGLLDGLRTRRVGSMRDYLAPPAGVATVTQAVHASGIPLHYPRLLFTAVNALGPLLVFLLLRRRFGIARGPALAAALLLAFASRDVTYYASFVLPDALGATLAAAVLLVSLKGMDDTGDRLRYWVLAGCLTGMTYSVAVRLVLVATLPALALAVARNRDRMALKACAVAGAIVAGFVVTSPYTVLDLPEQLENIAALSWGHDRSWPHRVSSLAFYLGGMFRPGFQSAYSDTAQGSAGFGILAGLLAWAGLWRMGRRYPRHTVVMAGFAAVHLYLILPIVERYTRHALVLYPIVCVWVGLGISAVADMARETVARLAGRRPDLMPRTGLLHGIGPWVMPALCLAVWAGQFRLTFDYVHRFAAYKPSQVRTAEFLQTAMTAGDKVGILDAVPWVESDLSGRGISFCRIPANSTVEALRRNGVTHVVGAQVLDGQYAVRPTVLWAAEFPPETRLAAFGEMALAFAGYPSGNLRLFVAAVPPAAASLAGTAAAGPRDASP